jgi:hypothetical protein
MFTTAPICGDGRVKTCTRCRGAKPLDQFPPVRRGHSRLQSWCRACFAEVNAANYRKDAASARARIAAYIRAQREVVHRRLVEYLQAHPCVDCGERDLVVLEFDHLGEKVADISVYAGGRRTWPTVLAEIEKCAVRCANCHRRMTAQRVATAHRDRSAPAKGRRRPIQLDIDGVTITQACRACGVMRSLNEFPFRTLDDRRRHRICLDCQRQWTNRWYADRKGGTVRAMRRRGTARRDVLARAVFSFLTEHPCVDCGEDDPLVLDFDHLRDKSANVSDLVADRAPWDVIVREIEKCAVRCVNCHRRRTARANGGYRLQA